MRVVAIAPTAEMSGAESVLLRYLVHVQDKGWAATCLVPAGTFADELRASGVQVCLMPHLGVPAGSRLRAATRLARRWATAARLLTIAAHDADIVLVNGTLALPVVRLARVGVPVTWLVHDVVHRRSWRLWLRAWGPAVDVGFAVSEAVAGPLRAAGMTVRLVRNGTTWPVTSASPAGDGPPVIGINAMLVPWKGHGVLLEAAARLDVPFRLELMGGWFARDAPYAEALRRQVSALDLTERVQLLGHVADPLDRMRTWTVAVNASVEPEAAPLCVLEAMSIGVPLVATDHGGTPEVLGGAGLLVPPGDAQALADGLRHMITDPDLRRACAVAGPAAVAADRRLEDAADHFCRVLSEIARTGSRHEGVVRQ